MPHHPTSDVIVVSTAGHDRHDTGSGHPERAARLEAVEAGIAAAQLGDALVRLDPEPAPVEDLERVHDPGYLRTLEYYAAAGGGHLDPDTVVSAGSWPTALLAAGATLTALAAMRSGTAAGAFVAVRPPGHHANRERPAGFCLINNIALAAARLVADGERVLIVDWDVHHGNGTQDIFWNEPSVMYVSTHQWPAYPGTGRPRETGGPEAPGTVLNFALPPGATGDVALGALDEVVAPAVERFAPTWVLVSAGFDAHRADPLADLAWSAGDFALLIQRVSAFAPGPGRVLAVLEGGYDLHALRECVAATVAGLAGAPATNEKPTSGGPGFESIRNTAAALASAAGAAQ